MPSAVIHARWVVPVTSPPIENGRLVIQDGRIAEVGRAGRRSAAATDLGDAVILPGFVNAHTHLELTRCKEQVPYRGSFVEWIATLASGHPRRGPEEALRRAIREGFGQSLSAGVTAVADIGSGAPAIEEWDSAPVHTVGFLEVLGMGARRPATHAQSIDVASALCREAVSALLDGSPSDVSPLGSRPVLRRIGIAPHAPYTADVSVFRGAIDLVRETHCPICTHLAETREEEQFLRDGGGPFRVLLERFGLWDGSFRPPGCSPVEYAGRLGLLACGPVLAHVNYLTDADVDLLAHFAPSVAYCPRSHHFFRHEPHRYRDMLARGINVCIGTDSLASNQTLSILDELRCVRAEDPMIDARQLLAMGTIAGARALGLVDEIGSLEVGKRADLVVLPLDHPRTTAPVEDILAGGSQPSAVYVGGVMTPGTDSS